MSKVEIYSTKVCGFCRKAKALLDGMGIKYIEYDVYEDADALNVMRECKFMTVPQISIDDVWIGGYTELKEMADSGALDSLKP